LRIVLVRCARRDCNARVSVLAAVKQEPGEAVDDHPGQAA
jgi:hypothetical protein